MKINETGRITELESVDHHTQERPFGIYHIEVPFNETQALYVHCHTENEIFLLTAGKVEFIVEQNKYKLSAGDAIFVPPMLLHGAVKKRGTQCRFTAIVFSTDMIISDTVSPIYTRGVKTSILSCIYPIYKNDERNKRILDILELLPDNDGREIYSCELAVMGVLYIVWQELYNLCFSSVIPGKDDASYKQIDKIVSFVQQHYYENITLKELADVSGFSEGYFGHYFLKEMGVAPFTYINKVRIAHACRLLDETDKKITEIAVLTGFNNISYFNRIFIKHIGMTPSSFRKNRVRNSYIT